MKGNLDTKTYRLQLWEARNIKKKFDRKLKWRVAAFPTQAQKLCWLGTAGRSLAGESSTKGPTLPCPRSKRGLLQALAQKYIPQLDTHCCPNYMMVNNKASEHLSANYSYEVKAHRIQRGPSHTGTSEILNGHEDKIQFWFIKKLSPNNDTNIANSEQTIKILTSGDPPSHFSTISLRHPRILFGGCQCKPSPRKMTGR